MSEWLPAIIFWGSSVPAGLGLALLIVNLASDWLPFRRHHTDSFCAPWQWVWSAEVTRACYHETPDGPRCCNCGLKPPRDKPEHGNKLKGAK